MRYFLGILGWIVLTLGVGSANGAQTHPLKGVALVIGQSSYARLPELANPDSDARNIDHMLDDLGFQVQRVLDASTDQLVKAIAQFTSSAKGADVALVYYSGHGVEIGGRDFILGLDADLSTSTAAATSLVPVDAMLALLGKEVSVSIVLLDACRTNPFDGQSLMLAGTNQRDSVVQLGSEDVRGPTVPQAARKPTGFGEVMGFSASPGQSALDGPPGQNSPYAAAILRHLGAPGYSFSDLMTLVSEEVYVDTDGRQLPWTNSSLNRVLYFGRPADEPKGDDAANLADRRKLLLSIGEVPDTTRAYVETVAEQEGLKLSDLYSMLDIINGQKGRPESDVRLQLLGVAKRVRDVLDDPILSEAPTDPELVRLDTLAKAAIGAGAFKRAFGFRELEVKRAAEIEKNLDKRQAEANALLAQAGAQLAEINTQRRELAGVYARVAEAALLTLNDNAEARALARAARQTDLFDKSLSVKFRLRAADVASDKAGRTFDLHADEMATALYKDLLASVDRAENPALWGSIQLKLGWSLSRAGMSFADKKREAEAEAAARAALSVFTPDSWPRKWNEAELLLAQAQLYQDLELSALASLGRLLDQTSTTRFPLDWAAGEHLLGETLFSLGWWKSGGTDQLRQAQAAFTASADAYQKSSPSEASFSKMRAADAAVRIAFRNNNHDGALATGLAAGKAAIAELKEHDLLWGEELHLHGIDLVLAAEAGDDRTLAEQGLAELSRAEGLRTRRSRPTEWSEMREYDGDAFALLARLPGSDPTNVTKALTAYSEAVDVFHQLGDTTSEQRTRLKIYAVKQILKR